jgi:hypothetical protein
MPAEDHEYARPPDGDTVPKSPNASHYFVSAHDYAITSAPRPFTGILLPETIAEEKRRADRYHDERDYRFDCHECPAPSILRA